LSEPATVVLVHGAFHGAWCWKYVASALRARGVDVRCFDLPGHGDSTAPLGSLAEDAQAVRQVLDACTGEVVVCGHSYGGMVIGEAVGRETERVRHLLYVAAAMPDVGESLSDCFPGLLAAELENGTMSAGHDSAGIRPDPAQLSRARDHRTLAQRREQLPDLHRRSCHSRRVPAASRKALQQELRMGVEPFPHAESTRPARELDRRPGELNRARSVRWSTSLFAVSVALAVLLADVFVPSAGAEPTAPEFPSKIVLGLRATCLETCQEKEGREPCVRYCDCHLFELRRDITDRQLEQLLLTAERGGENADSIRAWLVGTAKVCEKRIFGDKAPKTPGDGTTGSAKSAEE
jgi:pimeloyl-ACP methyl ester carboxylesterase